MDETNKVDLLRGASEEALVHLHRSMFLQLFLHGDTGRLVHMTAEGGVVVLTLPIGAGESLVHVFDFATGTLLHMGTAETLAGFPFVEPEKLKHIDPTFNCPWMKL